MIYKTTKNFLITNFQDNKTVGQFSQIDTQNLYKELMAIASEEEILSSRDMIRKAFTDYTKPIGKTLVLFRSIELIVVKISFYEKLDAASNEIKTLKELLSSKKDSVLSANSREDLVEIGSDLSRELLQIVSNLPQNVDFRELIREAIRAVFELDPKDMVVFLNQNIFIRKFVDTSHQKTGIERRFGGLPPAELERLKNEIFQGSISTAFKEIAISLTQNELNFSRITNDMFESEAVGLIQAKVVEFLQDKLDHDPEVINGFAGYLLRENFEFVFYQIASDLVERLIAADSGAEKFIKYYSGDVTLRDGMKYQLPEILDSDQMKWNFSTIKTVSMQHNQNRIKTREKIEQIQAINSELSGLDQQIERAKELSDSANKELVAIKVAIEENGSIISGLRENLAIARKDALRSGIKEENSESISEITTKIKEQVKYDEELFKSRSRLENETKTRTQEYEVVERKKLLLGRKIKDEEEKLQQLVANQDTQAKRFETMTEAIAKALTRKKIKL